MYFPKNFCNIGERSFDWVYVHKKEFVQHTVQDMKKPTGIFKKWLDYCKERIKISGENKKK